MRGIVKRTAYLVETSGMTAHLVIAAAGVFGLLVGSFLNVVVYRVPRGESVVSPPSSCPACGGRIRAYDNIPVLSWLILRARCRSCGAAISARYPLVELLTAGVFSVLAAVVGPHWQLPAFLYLGAVGVALALIDLDVKRLPNALVLPSYPVALLLLALPGPTTDWPAYGRAVLGGCALYAVFYLLRVVQPRGMGFGDVKLAGVLGLYLGWLGWGPLIVGGFLGFLLGGVTGVALIAAGRAGRKTAVPFGPFMLAGALLGIVWGGSLAQGYVDLLAL